MDKLELLRSIRIKDTKTDAEALLLKYSSALSVISTIIVDESKVNIDSSQALKEIRDILKTL